MVRNIGDKERKDLRKELLDLAIIAGQMLGIEDIDLFSDRFFIGSRLMVTPTERRISVYDPTNIGVGQELGSKYEAQTGEEWEVYKAF